MTRNPDVPYLLFPEQGDRVATADAFSVHRRLVLAALFLVAAHGVAMLFRHALDHDMAFGVVPLFDFYEERNVPTYFSSLNLLLTAGLLLLTARLERLRGGPNVRAWQVLGLGFAFMSLDEFADLRIILSRALQSAAGGKFEVLPFLSVGWTVPVAFIVAGLAMYMLPFLMRLERSYLVHFALAGACFVFASIGLENFEGKHAELTRGKRDLAFMLMVTLEETMEIFSVLYFQYFLLRYLRRHYPGAALRLGC